MVQVLGVQFLDFSRCILPWRTNAPVKNISITQKVSLYVFLVSLSHNNSSPSPGQPVFCFLTSQFSFACLRLSYTSNHKACTLLCPGFLLSMMLMRFSNLSFVLVRNIPVMKIPQLVHQPGDGCLVVSSFWLL